MFQSDLSVEAENLRKWAEPFTFIQAADTQYGMIDSMKTNNPNNFDYNWDEEVRLTERAIEIANNLKPRPKFYIVCGDLVNAYPGEKNKAAQIAAFKETFKKSRIPLVCVCGNHDVGNSPDPSAIEAYRKDFGADYFSWWTGGVKFIVLNSQYYYDDSKVKPYSEAQSKWLDKELSPAYTTGAQHIVTFQHIPWFINDPFEDPVTYKYGELVGFYNLPLKLRLNMLEKLRNSGVSKVFCGHYHRNAGGFYTGIPEAKLKELQIPSQDNATNSTEISNRKIPLHQDSPQNTSNHQNGPSLPTISNSVNKPLGALEVITTSAVGCQLGTDKSGFRLVKIYPDRIEHKYFEIDNFSSDPFLIL